MKQFFLQTSINKSVLSLNVLCRRLLFYLQKRQLKMCQFVEDIVISLETLRMTQVFLDDL